MIWCKFLDLLLFPHYFVIQTHCNIFLCTESFRYFFNFSFWFFIILVRLFYCLSTPSKSGIPSEAQNFIWIKMGFFSFSCPSSLQWLHLDSIFLTCLWEHHVEPCNKAVPKIRYLTFTATRSARYSASYPQKERTKLVWHNRFLTNLQQHFFIPFIISQFFYFFLMQIDQLFVSKSPHGPHVLNLTHFSFLKIIYCPCPSVRDLMSGSWKTSSVTQKSQTFLLTTAYSVKLAMDLEIFQNVGISKFKIQCSQDDIPCSKLWFLNELSASVLATRFMHN